MQHCSASLEVRNWRSLGGVDKNYLPLSGMQASKVQALVRHTVVLAQAQEWYREDLVGQAVIESGIPREELFLTSKLHPRHHGYDAAMIQVPSPWSKAHQSFP